MSGNSAKVIPRDWQRWSSIEPSVLWPLGGGLTNQSYLIAAGGEKWVLRKNSTISDALDLNRSGEAAALRHADKAGLCAPIIYCDPGYQYLVTRYIKGRPWRVIGADDLKRLANMLHRIHALPPINVYLDIRQKISRYWYSIDKRVDFFSELQDLNHTIDSRIAAVQTPNSATCLCHNDLLSANLIAADSGRLYVIDWEYAAMGDPFYELAVIVEEYRLDKAQQELLIAEYLSRPLKTADWQRLAHWRAIYRYLSLLWYAVQWSTGAMREAHTREHIFRSIRELRSL
ncbi:choline kinase family protein [Microbulbifer thermotolerans]|uniref:Choline kinase family protein n=1 Tax=Microbulbifer thermotolerans TaxID=252514 RepID=A0AB35HXX6_MICTH|nr:choline kinase family protein [Microbulbifer thermotolerans]MCX2801637.1 choline kinase family protein [Microbulbifer thermotolerans]